MHEIFPVLIAKRLLATAAALFLPTAAPCVDAAKLALAATGVTAFFLFTSPYYFPGGADHFTLWTEALAHGTKLDAHLAQRDIGFPLLILLSGYTVTGSFIGITLIHATFALLMPLLLYLALYRISRPVAFYTGICAIVSLAPVYFMKWFHHDQAYIFFTVLTLALLACYLQTRRYAYLYFFTAAILAASISRPAGNVLFPIFLVIAYVAARGRLLHYAMCSLIFVGVTAGYLKHRYEIFDMANRPSMPSYTGQQIFYNAYMNSAEFGVPLSPDRGPNFAALIESFRAALQPSVRESGAVAGATPGAPADFMEQAFYRYSPDELVQRALRFPNWDYYNTMSGAEPNDQVFLKASLEIFRAYPWYPVAYTARNTWHLLASPGYAHTRYNLNPFGPIGNIFPPGVGGTGAEGTTRISARAQREVAFVPLSIAPARIRDAFEKIAVVWHDNYQAMVKITLALMAVSWLGAVLSFASLFRRAPSRVSALGGALTGDGLVACIVAASVLLMYNIGVTAAFAEPDYRYHHFIVLLRILISGYGLVVVLRLMRLAPQWNFAFAHPFLVRNLAALRVQDGIARFVMRHPAASLGAAAILTFVTFIAWAEFMIAHVGKQP